MTAKMKRRQFITLLGGMAAWPLAARAQQGERVRRIGIIQTASSDDAEYQARVGALLQELQQLGWMIGRNIRIDTRWTKGDPDDARKYAAELVALAPDAIVATGISTVGPLLQLTRTIPIVFPAASDPVAAGLVESLARPGGNVTGLLSFEAGHQPQSREGARHPNSRQATRTGRRGDRMKRREFITLLGGAAAWPVAARAQQLLIGLRSKKQF